MLTQGSTSPTLTDREREVAKLVALGYGQKQIADLLELSTNTIGAHLRNIGDKIPGNGRRCIRITAFVLTQASTRAA